MPRWSPLLLLALPAVAWAASGGGGEDATFTWVLLAAMLVGSLVLVAVKRPWGLVAAALSGAVLAAILTVEHNAPASAKILSCGSSDLVSCEAVNKSEWSEVGGLPIALLGLGYFVTVAFFALRNAVGRAPLAPVAIAGLAGLALAYDAFLAFVMITQIKKACPLCITTWLLNLILLVGGLLEWRRTGRSFGDAFVAAVKESGDYAAIVGLATVVIGGIASRKGSGSTVTTPEQGGSVESLAEFYEQPMGTVVLDGTEPVKGDPGARFTIVEWADYECPHCAQMFGELKRVLEKNPDVKVLYKHFPLSPSCNPAAPYGRHENACNAAAAAECARHQGLFFELSQKMYENQQYLAKDDIRFMANQVKLDMNAFEACMADPATAQAVVADAEAGGAAHVEGTPSLFVKGLFGDRWVRLTGGEDAMNALFAVARSGTELPDPPPPSHEPH